LGIGLTPKIESIGPREHDGTLASVPLQWLRP
jgi:hypothetical protein